jgi:hypothetical protein
MSDSTGPRENVMRMVRAALVGLLLATAGGCQYLRLTSLGPDQPPPKESPSDLPGKTQLRVSQYVFHADFQLSPNLPLFRDLSSLHEQVYRELRLPDSRNLVQVYLFESKQRYEQYMLAHHPDLPNRRAFFMAQQRPLGGGDDLFVYTYWGENVSQDLRHELTHALLHAVLKDVPLWLDEGLAEFFELPPSYGGVNFKHVEQLRERPIHPDLVRLEELTEVNQMNPAEYRESWAWVHLMLRTTPAARRVLLAYLADLRTNPHPGPLRPRLLAVLPDADAALTRHLDELARIKSRPVTAQR